MESRRKGLSILCMGELSVASEYHKLFSTHPPSKDGGGIHGPSSLILLSEIMNRLHGPDKATPTPIPADYFDIIAGTGTGGVSACMLGRLRMPVDEAIKAQMKLLKTALSEHQMGLGERAAYKGTKLREALKTMVQDVTENGVESMREKNTTDGCKTMVFAMLEHNISANIPTTFRSYQVEDNSGPDCAIWEALYATMAHPDLFEPIEISDGSVQKSFVSGDIGCSNPIAHVLTEARRLYQDRHVSCILSIGAGHAGIVQISHPSSSQWKPSTQLAKMMKDMATDSERMAEEIAAQFQETPRVYYRFNVGQGMQGMEAGDMGTLNEATEHTKVYIRNGETSRRIDQAVQTIKNGKVIAAIHIDGQVNASSSERVAIVKRYPAPTTVFTGREGHIQQIGACITGGSNERRVCVIRGLGGAGKTQLALKAIEQHRDSWTHVLYCDASTKKAIEMMLQDFAKVKKIGGGHENTIGWLEQCHDPWLMVFDNADDPSLDLNSYFPGGNRGSILITSRLRGLVIHARGPDSGYNLSTRLKLTFLLSTHELSGALGALYPCPSFRRAP